MRKNRRVSPRDCIVKGTNTATGEVEYFLNVASVVKVVGCTKAHAYNVLNKVGYFKTAKGWKLEWVDFNDVSVLTSKKGVKAVDIDYWQMLENTTK